MNNPLSFKQHLYELATEIFHVCKTLFRIMIPMIILVKILQELDMIPVINELLSPIMQFVGLPESVAIVLTTTLVTNLYTGLLIFFQNIPSGSLSVAEVSILGGMMLMGHNIFVEVPIMQKSGVRLLPALVVRLGGAFVFGLMLHYWYEWTGTGTEPANWAWQPAEQNQDLLSWSWNQLQSLAAIVVIIAALITMIRVLRYLHIEKWMIRMLKPVLKLLGIAHNAASMTIVGMLLGLAFGGGLLIREAQSGHIAVKDIFACIVLLGLCHSLIEDTILILLMGADLTAILWLRLLFSIIIVAVITRVLPKLSESMQQKYLLHDVAQKAA